MRLWHQKLIPLLPEYKTSGVKRWNQLGGQHRECCVMRGKWWGSKHKTVDYAWKYGPVFLVAYHLLIMDELMLVRGYRLDERWRDPVYRGPNAEPWSSAEADGIAVTEMVQRVKLGSSMIYPEHNQQYLRSCLYNLRGKGVELRGRGPIGNPRVTRKERS